MSRAGHPKQLQPLCSDRPMIADTALRITGGRYKPPIIVCNEQHRFSVAEALRDAGVPVDRIVLEPESRNTAPAIALAALTVVEEDPEGLLLILPSDHVINDTSAFQLAVDHAVEVASGGVLVTFGVTPIRPETGYGYIQAGLPLKGSAHAFHIASFKEKPDAATAATYVDDGRYYWNSGMFILPVAELLEDLDAYCPGLLDAARTALKKGHADLDFQRVDHGAFATMPSVSIDVAVMEQTSRAAVIPVDIGWSDVGAWTTLWEIGPQDEDGNVLVGDVLCRDVERSYIRSDNGPLLTVDGLSDMVVVATDDAVLVTTRERAQNVRMLVDDLKRRDRSEYQWHSLVHRPWGTYRGIDQGDRFQVQQIMVKPGAKLSAQYHHHRAEHWIVVEGTARVTRGDQVFLLRESESTFIRAGETHRLENPGVTPLRLIKVQSSAGPGEDDIVRLDDSYGRIQDDE